LGRVGLGQVSTRLVKESEDIDGISIQS